MRWAILSPRSILLTPHGMPTMALGSELYDTGLNQRRVMAGLRRVDLRMARPREERSPAEVYMFPVLDRYHDVNGRLDE